MVALLIGSFLDEGQTILDAIKSSVRILEGAYSFIMISILDPEAMYVVKNCGTMVIGFPKSMIMEDGQSDKISMDSLSNIDSGDEDEEQKQNEQEVLKPPKPMKKMKSP